MTDEEKRQLATKIINANLCLLKGFTYDDVGTVLGSLLLSMLYTLPPEVDKFALLDEFIQPIKERMKLDLEKPKSWGDAGNVTWSNFGGLPFKKPPA